MSTTLLKHTDSTGPISYALIALDHAEHSAEHWSRIRYSARPPTRIGSGTHLRVGSAPRTATTSLRGHLIQEHGPMSVFAVSSSRQDGADSPVNRRDMLSIIAQ